MSDKTRDQLLLELEEKERLLAAFHRIGAATLSSLDLDQILDTLGQEIVRAGIFRSLMIALVDPESHSVVVHRSFVCKPQGGILVPGGEVESRPDMIGLRYSLDDDNITAEVARTGRMRVFDEWHPNLDPRVDPPGGKTMVDKVSYFIPIRQKERVLGVLATASRVIYKEEILQRIQAMQPLLDQVAIALLHARLFAALQQSEERFRQMAENIDEVFWMTNADKTQILYISPGYEKVWQRSRSSIYTQPQSWLEAIHSEDRERVLAATTSKQISGQYDEEYRILRPDGELRWIRDRAFPVRDAQGRIARIAGIAEDITEQKQDRERLSASLAEKEVLIKEVHHRVKNNLQVVTSLLSLQELHLEDERVRSALQDCRTRLMAMSLIHEQLYESRDLRRIDMGPYLHSLTRNLVGAHGLRPGHIAMEISTADVALEIGRAIPCGLIVNELVSNALKHAFPDGRHGRILVALEKSAQGECLLTVRDNGIGFPPDLDFRSGHSLGLKLVDRLVRQLGGRIDLERAGYTEFRITWSTPPDEPAF